MTAKKQLRGICVGLLLLLIYLDHISADEFTAGITKVENQKVFFVKTTKEPKAPNKKKKQADDFLVALDTVKIYEAKSDPRTNKVVSGEELFGGLENEDFQERVKKGGLFWLTTDVNNKISEIRFFVSRKAQNGPPPVRSISHLSENDSAAYDYVMAGIKASRGNLTSGVFRASGQYTEGRPESPTDFKGEMEVYCAFDSSFARCRFDRSMPKRVFLSGIPKKDPNDLDVEKKADPNEKKDKWKMVTEKTSVVFTPKEIIEFAADTIKKYSADDKSISRIRRAMFDVRALGLYGKASFTKGSSFEDRWQMLQTNRARDIERDPNKLWKINWEPESSDALETLWVDESKGFSVVRHEIRAKSKSDQSKWESEPLMSSDVAWSLLEGAWVPTTFVLKEQSTLLTVKYELAFEWEALNRPISDEVFTTSDFQIKKRTIIVDMKTGRPIITDVLKPSLRQSKNAVTQESKVYVGWIALGNTVCVLLILGYMWFRKKHRSE